MNETQILRDIPSVSAFLDSQEGQTLLETFGVQLVKLSLRDQLDNIRESVLAGTLAAVNHLAGIGQT